ncbi:ABC transporter permease [Adhaeribacter pallidiroseus]|uniref:Macrolide export ATP-binding/permease protein MacB n=1 Tax=Adhaeribacter pallidiroseus TaxID=2072847 RepID=A0A369QLI0_9BACT|nr:ABC transporter permease [Adhaeribacter pallidiroseus]RDC65564.1 Macrolide export ATP-binding/permease protein MacB [Adhaeribacter pallidiroseus]
MLNYFFFVRNELSYDTYHTAADRLYRVAIDIQSRADNRVFAQTSAPLAAALQRDFPQIEKAVRLVKQSNQLVTYGPGKSFYERTFYLADPQILEVFTLPLVKGNAQTALNRPGTLIITEELAKKYFGNTEPLGKILKVNQEPFEVTGILKNLPYNSHLKMDLITSLATWNKQDWYKKDVAENWHSTMFYTYIKVKEQVNIPAFEKQIKTAANKYVREQIKDWGVTYHYFLQPVKAIHLHSQLKDEAEVPGNAINVYILIVVAVLIIFIASLNYINLTTAQSANRAKEVGVRKVIGATKKALMMQFLCESLLLTFMALVLALAIVFLTRPLFEALSGQTYAFALLFTPQFILTLLGLTGLVGIAAAIYPALVLASFRPVTVLKGSLSLGAKGGGLRQALVVCQFTISLMLLVGTMMVYRQLNFMKDQNLGFEKEQMLVLPVRGTSMADNYEQIKSEFQRHPAVVSATTSASVPGQEVQNFAVSLKDEADDKGQSMYYLFTDFDFLKTYGIPIIAGRNFDKTIQTDKESAFLINEKAVKAFGWATPEEAIGKKLAAGFGGDGEIIGVYKDFHYRSLQAPIEPLIMAMVPWRLNTISLRLNTKDLPATMAFVQKKWQELFPQNPYEYAFLDEEFNKQYQADEKIGRIFLVFTAIAIFIACLGLFGLATFVAQQRTKEIGVRKVLGASVSSIVSLVSKDFVKLVLVSFVIATPLSYVLIGKWLENFASRIAISWEVFVIAGLALLVMALLTVSYQSIRAALANPVNSLRNE